MLWTLSRTQFPVALLGLLLGVEIFWVGGTLFDECNTSITTSQKSRARIPSIRKPASSEVISDPVELWYTEVCFLHIQLMGTHVRLPNIHKIHPEVDFESSRSPAKIRVLAKTQSAVLSCITHMTILSVINHACGEYRISNELVVCHKFVSIWWLREQACLRTKECQVYRFEPRTSISRPFENTQRTILRLFPTPPSWNCDHPSKAVKLCAIAPSSCLPVHSTILRSF